MTSRQVARTDSAAATDPQNNAVALETKEVIVQLLRPPDEEDIKTCSFKLGDILDQDEEERVPSPPRTRRRTGSPSAPRLQVPSSPSLKADWFEGFFKSNVLIPLVLISCPRGKRFRSLNDIINWNLGLEGVSFHSADGQQELVDDKQRMEYLVREDVKVLCLSFRGAAQEIVFPLCHGDIESEESSSDNLGGHDDNPVDRCCNFCWTKGINSHTLSETQQPLFILSLGGSPERDLNHRLGPDLAEIMKGNDNDKVKEVKVGKLIAGEVTSLFKNGQVCTVSDGSTLPLLPMLGAEFEKFCVIRDSRKQAPASTTDAANKKRRKNASAINHCLRIRLHSGQFHKDQFVTTVQFCPYCYEIKEFSYNGKTFPVVVDPATLQSRFEHLMSIISDDGFVSIAEDGSEVQAFLPLPNEIEFKEVEWLCHWAKTYFAAEGAYLEIKAPASVIGDLHGEAVTLKRILGMITSKGSIVFLGDIVDRGNDSVIVVLLVIMLKILKPNHTFLLRGNHETTEMNGGDGITLKSECLLRFGEAGDKWWQLFNDLFNCLPYGLSIHSPINDTLLGIGCVHGGISPALPLLPSWNDTDPDPKKRLHVLKPVIWSDPIDVSEPSDPSDVRELYYVNERGPSTICFGRSALKHFLSANSLKLLLRGHGKTKGRGCSVIWGGKVATIQSNGASGEAVCYADIDDHLNVRYLGHLNEPDSEGRDD